VKSDAVDRARDVAKKQPTSQVVVRKQDGTIQLLPNHEVRLARREALEQIAGGF